jgi:hypothetical protein
MRKDLATLLHTQSHEEPKNLSIQEKTYVRI